MFSLVGTPQTVSDSKHVQRVLERTHQRVLFNERNAVMLAFKVVQGNKSSLGAHSRAVLTTARAAAPKATVRPIIANLTKRRAVEGRATVMAGPAAELSGEPCFCLRRRKRTESGRC